MDDRSALASGALAGGVALLEVAGTLQLWLVNADGPFDDARAPGLLIALVGGGLAGAAVLLLVQRVALRSAPALVALGVVLATAAWVLLPQQIDVYESFVARPNERSSCTGWTFTHYPVGVMDASSTRWCVGLEHPIGRG